MHAVIPRVGGGQISSTAVRKHISHPQCFCVNQFHSVLKVLMNTPWFTHHGSCNKWTYQLQLCKNDIIILHSIYLVKSLSIQSACCPSSVSSLPTEVCPVTHRYQPASSKPLAPLGRATSNPHTLDTFVYFSPSFSVHLSGNPLILFEI